MKSFAVLLPFAACSILATAVTAESKAQRAHAPSPDPVFREIVS